MTRAVALLLRLAGGLLVAVGLIAAWYGPYEIYVFYLFSPGGPFHYDGFGVGSLWFAYLVLQNVAYYVVAALLLPVGIGHLHRRAWALPLTRLFLWCWLGGGLLLALYLPWLLPFLPDTGVSPAVYQQRLVIAGAVGTAALVVMPALLLWLYHRRAVTAYFARSDVESSWVERTPLPVLALLLLLAAVILVLHMALFVQALFPWFGDFILGRPVAPWIAMLIVITGVLAYGVARRRRWAWWAVLAYFALLATSSALSFSRHSVGAILRLLTLPPAESAVIAQLPALDDLYLAALVTAPLLAGMFLLLTARRHFAAD